MESPIKLLKLASTGLEIFRSKAQPGQKRIQDAVRATGGNLIPANPEIPQKPWNNRDNQESYYDLVSNVSLDQRARAIGMNACPELEIIKGEIFSTIPERLLEVGAGSGRALKWMLKQLPGSDIIAVEFNAKIFKSLSKDFKRFSNIELMERNILEVNLKTPVQFAFLLWSVFAEFNPAEKATLLKKLRAQLSRGGKLAIDLPRLVAGEAEASARGGDFLVHRDEFGTLSVHLSNDQEIFEMARNAGFVSTRRVEYSTATGLPRVCFILQN